MERRPLGNTGLSVPRLSFGASSLGGVFRPINEGDAIRTVHLAIDQGVNFIDVAPYYGLTKAETVLGRALRGVPRERYMLATKVGRYGNDAQDFDFSAARVTRSIDESLQRLGVEYVDLIQAHDIEFGDLDQIIQETVPALREVQRQGKARFVGVTGLPLVALRHVVERVAVDTILSYCHYTLNDTSLLELIPFLQSRGVGVINASPLSMALLSTRGAPAWHPAPQPLRDACAAATRHCTSRGVPIERLAIHFAVANPDIATTLVGTADPAEMQQNIRWAQEPIDEQLLAEVLALLAPVKDVTWPSGRSENNRERPR